MLTLILALTVHVVVKRTPDRVSAFNLLAVLDELLSVVHESLIGVIVMNLARLLEGRPWEVINAHIIGVAFDVVIALDPIFKRILGF